MNLIKREDVPWQVIQGFVKNAFQVGCVPEKLEDFMKCISDETTDGSRCFANTFGATEQETAMLFFYPFHCAVPPRYQKYIRGTSPNKMELLVLDYQLFLAQNTNNGMFLDELRTFMEESYFVRNYMAVINRAGEALSSSEYMNNVKEFEDKYRQVKAFIDNKISSIVNNCIITVTEEDLNIDDENES